LCSSLFRLIYLNTGWSSNNFWKFYCVIPSCLLLFTFFWPTKAIVIEEEADTLLNDEKKRIDIYTTVNEIDETLPQQKTQKLEDLSFWNQFKTIDYVGELVYVAVTQVWLNMYLGTVEKRLHAWNDEVLSKKLVDIFAIILPATFPLSPLIGYVIDKAGHRWTILLLHIQGITFTMLLFIRMGYPSVITFFIFSIYRGFYYSSLIVYIVHVFGWKSFGKLWGTLMLVSGGINLLQYFFLDVSLKKFEGSFLVVNYIQLGVYVAGFAFPIMVIARRSYDFSPTQNGASVDPPLIESLR